MVFRKMILLGLAATGLAACEQGHHFDLEETADQFGAKVYYNNKVDVVFIADNSEGMEGYNKSLRDRIPTFVDKLLSLGLDLHIAVITSTMGPGSDGSPADGGRFLGSPAFLTSSSPNLAASLVNRIASVGSKGSNNERGLDSLMTVLSDSYRDGHGAGFLRPEALLAIVSLTSEDDHSTTYSSVNGYISRLDAIKGVFEDGTRRWTTNLIGVLSLSGSCVSTPGGSGYKEPGVRWIQMADVSNGVKESVCSVDYSTAASNIHRRISQILTDYIFPRRPDLATIRVLTAAGTEIPRSTTDGWEYQADRGTAGALRFYGSAVPTANTPSYQVIWKPADAN